MGVEQLLKGSDFNKLWSAQCSRYMAAPLRSVWRKAIDGSRVELRSCGEVLMVEEARLSFLVAKHVAIFFNLAMLSQITLSLPSPGSGEAGTICPLHAGWALVQLATVSKWL